MKKLLLASLLAGSATIAIQPEAKAAFASCTFNNLGACNPTLGNWAISNVASSSNSSTHLATFQDNGATLSTNFFFAAPPLNGPTSGFVSYELNYLGTNSLVSFVAGTTGTPPNAPPSVSVVGEDLLSNVILPSSVYSGSNSTSVSFLPGNKTAKILYSWNFAGGQSLATISSEVSSVPGPLPILGGGVAFAFSRRLRQRIKASA